MAARIISNICVRTMRPAVASWVAAWVCLGVSYGFVGVFGVGPGGTLKPWCPWRYLGRSWEVRRVPPRDRPIHAKYNEHCAFQLCFSGCLKCSMVPFGRSMRALAQPLASLGDGCESGDVLVDPQWFLGRLLRALMGPIAPRRVRDRTPEGLQNAFFPPSSQGGGQFGFARELRAVSPQESFIWTNSGQLFRSASPPPSGGLTVVAWPSSNVDITLRLSHPKPKVAASGSVGSKENTRRGEPGCRGGLRGVVALLGVVEGLVTKLMRKRCCARRAHNGSLDRTCHTAMRNLRQSTLSPA